MVRAVNGTRDELNQDSQTHQLVEFGPFTPTLDPETESGEEATGVTRGGSEGAGTDPPGGLPVDADPSRSHSPKPVQPKYSPPVFGSSSVSESTTDSLKSRANSYVSTA